MFGRIFDIQRFSTHDGPGIRTAVFFKGCPLRCLWCHNPEGISPRPELSYSPERCMGCAECARACPNAVHSFGATHTLDRQRCQACGLCAAMCDAGGLELVGRDVTVDEVMCEVVADRPFYESTGGGVTLSGGEPLLQIDFAAALLEASKRHGFHCAVETCGFVSWSRFHRVLPLVDLFLYDYKATGTQMHERCTGRSDEMILRNLRRLHEEGARIRLECPIVPGCNDTEEHLAGIRSIAGQLPHLESVNLLPYHPLGSGKAAKFGRPPGVAIDPGSALQTTRNWAASLRQAGVRVLDD